MADEKNPTPDLDDWDSLPLDPDGDDWDDIPVSPPPAPAAPEPEPELSPDDFDASDLTADDFDLPSDPPTDDFDLPGPPETTAADEPAPAPDEFELPDPAPADDFDAAPVAGPPAPAPDEDLDAAEDDFGAHLAALSLDEHFPPEAGEAPQPAPAEEAAPLAEEPAAPEEPATKKVELDIEGIFLEDHDDEPEAEEEAAEEAPPVVAEEPPPAEAPAGPAEDGPKKIPKLKLLIIVVPAVLLLAGLGFGAYKLFFAAEPEAPAPALVIDPRPPHREPEPGDLELSPFYINFPGSPSEIIVEMQVVLHYPDIPSKMIIDEKMPVIRDIIFRITQGQGSQVVGSGEMQRALRQELAAQANLALGGEHISYVQINQFRILH